MMVNVAGNAANMGTIQMEYVDSITVVGAKLIGQGDVDTFTSR